MTPATGTRWVTRPPRLDASQWSDPEMVQAVADEHFGRVVRVYRRLAGEGGRPLPQLRVAHWLEIGQSRLHNHETGAACTDPALLARWAKTLGMPAELAWFPLDDRDPAQ